MTAKRIAIELDLDDERTSAVLKILAGEDVIWTPNVQPSGGRPTPQSAHRERRSATILSDILACIPSVGDEMLLSEFPRSQHTLVRSVVADDERLVRIPGAGQRPAMIRRARE